jgi:drug/metabolite transporter (DMT)-like permease
MTVTAAIKPPLWQTLLAFGIIYFVWGVTFFAIRVGVREVPPLLFAAMRFLLAGLVLTGWIVARGERWPGRREWLSILALASLIFVVDYGLLFWAEQRVPSGIAAVMLATIPVFTALSEVVILRTQRLTVRLTVALLVGIAGVAVLMSRGLHLGGEPVDSAGAVALLVGAISWSLASALSRKLPLPESKGLSSGTQMLVGGILLTVAAGGFGEFSSFHPASISLQAWLALLFLIVFGSIVGFTAYVWLIHHQSPTKVGTYAYVNPVVAVIVGYFFGGEALAPRTILGVLFVLISVVSITTAKSNKPAQSTIEGEPN